MSIAAFLNIFRDPAGRIIIWQSPNLMLIGWVLCKLAAVAVDSAALKSGLSSLATVFLFTWAYLEITTGVNTFRKLLGFVVAGFIVLGFFGISL